MARSSRLSQIDERREEIAREAKRLTAERKLEARKRQRMQQRVGRVPTEDLLAVIADRHVAEAKAKAKAKAKGKGRAKAKVMPPPPPPPAEDDGAPAPPRAEDDGAGGGD